MNGHPGGLPGMVIAGRYELLRRLGRGAMGVVWEALDTRLDRKVAVKEMVYPDPGSAASDIRAQWVGRAHREARTVARVGHRNVISVHDVIDGHGDGGDDDQVWIVMELLDARSLADMLKPREPLSVPHAARIGLQVLRGLAAVHEAGVLHRDVKPSNILFRADGSALLTDFGVATYEGATQLTGSNDVIGSAPYLAPELLTREPGPYPATAASDLWALGVTLYEMVEGRRPFVGDKLQIMNSIVRDPLPPLRFGGLLTPLIEDLLRKDPLRRPSARALEMMLEEITRDIPAPTAPPAPRPEKAAEQAVPGEQGPPPTTVGTGGPGPERWNRWKVPLAVLCAALLVGGGWLANAMGDDAQDGKGSGSAPHPDAWARFKAAHPVLRVGVKAEQPPLSRWNNKVFVGFEPDLARRIGELLGYGEDQIVLKEVTSEDRVRQLTGDRNAVPAVEPEVDLLLASYSIRKDVAGVTFAGGYFHNHQGGILVRDKGIVHIDALSDLSDDRGVRACTVEGSTYKDWAADNKVPLTDEGLPGTYDKCVDKLLDDDSDVFAVITDEVITQGIADEHRDTKLVETFGGGARDYGVGLRSGDTVLKAKVCGALRKIMETRNGTSEWQKLYDEHLRPSVGAASGLPGLTECHE
ncbi:serine/threonine-protein kinase [Streptomyces abyssomicinicus]|uniref:serine/threonine-protein kinase n=1 Tax=Streptomyces abyssomicinicus TaxID=574929 RepID=UPI0012504BAD|nr:serine/threonine-protein kinase [Streptomyces abyssomicinicus]